MIDIAAMTPAQIREAAIGAVLREVGPVGLVYLLRDGVAAGGDFLRDREKHLPKYDTLDDLLDAIAREGAPENRDGSS